MTYLREDTDRLRRLTERHVAAADRLVEVCLGRPDGPTLLDTLPLLLRDERRSERWIIARGDDVVCHGALLIHDLVTPVLGGDPATIVVAVIGAIATTPERRGEGFAGQMVDHLVTRAASHRAHAVLLWADDDRLYRRHHFVRGGIELRTVVSPRPRIPLTHRTRPLYPDDLPALRRLHTAEPSHVLRDTSAWRTHLAIPAAHVFVAERAQRVQAYAVVGKGLDLVGHVHEVGGDDHTVAGLLFDLAHAAKVPLPVILPPWRERLCQLLGERYEMRAHACMRLLSDLIELPYLTGLDSA